MRDRASIEQRLAEAMAYCLPRVRVDDPKHSLRTLWPPQLLSETRTLTVERVMRDRARETGRLPPVTTRRSMLGGRLIVYFPDAQLSDGAAEIASHGFFDPNNCPAWDTWLDFAEASRPTSPGYTMYLLAFVPAEIVGLVGYGIDVNPEKCIAWLDDVDIDARDQLRRFLG